MVPWWSGEENEVTYVAIVQGETWSLSREDLLRELRARWPEAVVQVTTASPNADPARDVVWHTGEGSSRVDGWSHVSGQCIYVDGQNDAVAPIVAWYRGLVPDAEQVLFCDDTYSFDLELEPGVSPQRILTYLEKL
jgi:hypothetical protein